MQPITTAILGILAFLALGAVALVATSGVIEIVLFVVSALGVVVSFSGLMYIVYERLSQT